LLRVLEFFNKTLTQALSFCQEHLFQEKDYGSSFATTPGSIAAGPPGVHMLKIKLNTKT
jgi:hypothetical protein